MEKANVALLHIKGFCLKTGTSNTVYGQKHLRKPTQDSTETVTTVQSNVWERGEKAGQLCEGLLRYVKALLRFADVLNYALHLSHVSMFAPI